MPACICAIMLCSDGIKTGLFALEFDKSMSFAHGAEKCLSGKRIVSVDQRTNVESIIGKKKFS